MKDNKFYRELILNSSIGYSYHKMEYDENNVPIDYTFIEVNEAFGQITGLDYSTLPGFRVSEVIPGIRQVDFDWIQYYGNIVQSSTSDTFEQYSEVLGKWFKVEAFPFEKDYFVTLFVDISESKSNLEQLENFFSISLDLLCIANLDGYFIKLNKQWENTLGYSIAELKNTKYTDYIHPDDLEKTYNSIRELSEGTEILNFVNRYRCADGTYKHLEWRSRPEGNLIYAAVRDITEKILTEEKLKNRNEQFELAVLGSNAGLWDWDVKNDKIYLSPRWKAILGYSDDELPSSYDSFDKNVFPEDLVRVNNALKEYFAGNKKDYQIELRMKHKFGHYVWIASNAIALRDEEGVVYRMAGSHTDISEQRRAEENLTIAKETYKGILDSINELVYIQGKDGRFLDVNRAAEETYGYSKERFIGSTPEFLSADDLNDLKAVDDAIHKAANGQKQTFEFWGKRSDGSVFPKLVSLTLGNFFGKSSIITVARDISEQKANEKELQEKERKYRLIAENAEDVIWTLNLEGNFTFISPSIYRLRGITVEEAMNEKVNDTMPPKWAEYINYQQENAIKQLLAGNGYPSDTHEIQQYHKDGSLVWVEMHVKGQYNELNELIGIFGLSRNANKRKESEAELISYTHQLKKAINEKDKFFSIIANDLKVPFTGFLSQTKAIAENFNSFKIKELKEFGGELKKTAEELYNLLENLLEWANLQMGITKLIPETCQIKFIAEQNIESLSSMINSKKLRVLNNLSDDLTITADSAMINSIFKNLLSNAVKFTNRAGYIEIGEMIDKNSNTYFYVKDNGIGISSERQATLFKVDKILESNNEFSSGLGLLLCKEYLGMHGGEIQVDSAEGIGSIFKFSINSKK